MLTIVSSSWLAVLGLLASKILLVMSSVMRNSSKVIRSSLLDNR